MLSLAHAGTAIASAFIGSLVEAIEVLQLAVGVLLLLFGMRWLRKAILRAAGVIALHDEAAVFDKECAALRASEPQRGWDAIAVITAFKAVVLEGLEVVFIVLAVGAAGGLLLPASVGALAACVLVAVAGGVVYRPLARIPENTLKFAVGVLLSAFGVFWVGEGLGFHWPGDDLAILGIAALFLAVAAAAAPLARKETVG